MEVRLQLRRPSSARIVRSCFHNAGAQLALLGNCNVCHTAAGGPAYAGQRPVHTAFGTIYSTNIAPDLDTGIGRWSEAAFTRAMREGVDRRGRHLYPAFPYDHFTKASDEDIKSLYAFLMTREPVRAETPANELPIACEIELDRGSGRVRMLRAVAATDSGEAVNPDGIRNQIEGGILQLPELDPLRSRLIRHHPHYQPGLEYFPHLALPEPARSYRGPCDRPARPAILGNRRSGARSDRGCRSQRTR